MSQRPPTATNCEDVHVTILAGGSGTRLWPYSRQSSPKQLLDLFGDGSLLRNTIERVLPLVPWKRIYVLTGPDHADLIRTHLPELPDANLMVEPSPRGTAPSLGLAALRLRESNQDTDVMISLHADHVIADAEAFRRGLLAAVAVARTGRLVTMGIVPRSPETGFGYIERGEPLEIQTTPEHLPTVHQALEAVLRLGDHQTANRRQVWESITPVTIDVGIMEQARHVAVVPCDMGWNDVGSWATVYAMLPHDENGSALMACEDLASIESAGNLVYAPNKLVATIGVENLIIVDTPDALLVLPRARAQRVSDLVKLLRARGLQEHL